MLKAGEFTPVLNELSVKKLAGYSGLLGEGHVYPIRKFLFHTHVIRCSDWAGLLDIDKSVL